METKREENNSSRMERNKDEAEEDNKTENEELVPGNPLGEPVPPYKNEVNVGRENKYIGHEVEAENRKVGPVPENPMEGLVPQGTGLLEPQLQTSTETEEKIKNNPEESRWIDWSTQFEELKKKRQKNQLEEDSKRLEMKENAKKLEAKWSLLRSCTEFLRENENNWRELLLTQEEERKERNKHEEKLVRLEKIQKLKKTYQEKKEEKTEDEKQKLRRELAETKELLWKWRANADSKNEVRKREEDLKRELDKKMKLIKKRKDEVDKEEIAKKLEVKERKEKVKKMEKKWQELRNTIQFLEESEDFWTDDIFVMEMKDGKERKEEERKKRLAKAGKLQEEAREHRDQKNNKLINQFFRPPSLQDREREFSSKDAPLSSQTESLSIQPETFRLDMVKPSPSSTSSSFEDNNTHRNVKKPIVSSQQEEEQNKTSNVKNLNTLTSPNLSKKIKPAKPSQILSELEKVRSISFQRLL